MTNPTEPWFLELVGNLLFLLIVVLMVAVIVFGARHVHPARRIQLPPGTPPLIKMAFGFYPWLWLSWGLLGLTLAILVRFRPAWLDWLL